MARGVFLMTSDPQTERQVSEALRLERELAVETACKSLPDLVRELNSGPAPAVLVDLGQQPERTLALLDPIISRFADTRFVVMAANPSQSLLLEAMQVGARHFVAREAITADLANVLRRIIPNGAVRGGRGGHGFVATILSASGGVGATTIAINLANELRLAALSPTLLVDMDNYCGAAAAYLGLRPSYGLDAVLADAERIDGELIKSSSAIHDQNLYVLESPSASTRARHSHNAESDHLKYQHLPRFMAACKESFPYTVIDAPRLPLETAAELASSSTLTLIPFQATVVGIRAVRELINALVGQGCSGELLLPVINRFQKRKAMIGYEEVCKALARPTAPGRIENDYAPAVESINYGKPLSQASARSTLRKALASLANQIHQAHTSGQTLTITW
jgi:pilus assembly protein CpaE